MPSGRTLLKAGFANVFIGWLAEVQQSTCISDVMRFIFYHKWLCLLHLQLWLPPAQRFGLDPFPRGHCRNGQVDNLVFIWSGALKCSHHIHFLPITHCHHHHNLYPQSHHLWSRHHSSYPLLMYVYARTSEHVLRAEYSRCIKDTQSNI